jgi:hypothetical protein
MTPLVMISGDNSLCAVAHSGAKGTVTDRPAANIADLVILGAMARLAAGLVHQGPHDAHKFLAVHCCDRRNFGFPLREGLERSRLPSVGRVFGPQRFQTREVAAIPGKFRAQLLHLTQHGLRNQSAFRGARRFRTRRRVVRGRRGAAMTIHPEQKQQLLLKADLRFVPGIVQGSGSLLNLTPDQ